MKKFCEAIKERKKLIKQGFKNVFITYNFLSNYYTVMLFSREFIEKKFNKTHEIIL